MESIEKLRTAARNMAKGRNLENHEECNLLLIIADEIEREVTEQQKRWAQQAVECANDSAKLKLVELAHENAELKREIAEKYMELPVDADGEPIHVGDEVMYGVGNATHYVFAVSENAAWLNNSFDPPFVFLQEFASEQCRHVKPRTVEDVLNDFASEAYDVDGRDDEEWLPLLAKYAAELQMRGDAELEGGDD